MKNIMFIMRWFAVIFSLMISVAEAEKINFSLDDLEKYFSQLIEIKSEFQQITNDNSISVGNFLLNKPKKFMQMVYKTPTALEITLKNKKLIYYDRDLKEKTETSAHSSPLSFLLKNKIKLNNEVKILDVETHNNQLFVKVCRKNKENDGAITLIFKKNPLSLAGWIIFEHEYDEFSQKFVKILLLNPSIKTRS